MSGNSLDRLRVLTSFHFFRTRDFDDIVERLSINDVPPDIFADSGAFSAWTQGAEVTVDDYTEWLHKWKHYFSVYCSLDVIDDPVATEANQRALESNGLLPLPVWHIRSDRKHFEALCEEYRYVAVGGMVGTRWTRLRPKLTWAVRRGRELGTVLHGLGVSAPGVIGSLPLFSVDSTSWTVAYRYGLVSIWDDKTNSLNKVTLGKHAKWQHHAAAVSRLGFSPARFANREADRHEQAALSAVSTVLQEQHARRTLGLVPLPEGDKPEVKPGQDGLRLYLADLSIDNFSNAAQGLRSYLSSVAA